jgi:hypothetical protein
LTRELQAETTMNIGGDRRVLEVIGVFIFLAPKIKPRLRILMHK